ncbi:MAG: SDR family oxidoreductase [Actinomycetota bacterium]|nr:SDR family oxidoreductase [Actinomycetota bacterium]|tara:strand:- start:891 stop:1652 length:762 start_codon:yes stop_codon:yes gene_type:complete
MRTLKGKSVLITGGGSGIGEGAARHFASKGAKVTIAGRREEPLQKVQEAIGELCHVVVGDVTQASDRRRMVTEAVNHGEGLEVLISNAGNIYRCEVPEFDEEALLGIFHSNVVGGMMLVSEAHEFLREAKGCVIFVGSVHTQRAFPNASPYAATKGALESLTGVLAAELGPQGIRVSCVRPGAVITEINVRAGLSTQAEAAERLEGMSNLHALGRIGNVEDIAEAFEYLACSDWVTGNVLTVDGGLGLGVTNE